MAPVTKISRLQTIVLLWSVLAWASASLALSRAAADASAASQKALSATDAQGRRPWAEGVSSEQQEQALRLFERGNALLRDSIFVQAAATYREALKAWDHPGIHYNLALALLNLDQPLEVHEHLTRALRFGPDPLEADKYQYARNYLVLIQKQLSTLELRCEAEGASVALDGQVLFKAPGKYAGLLRPGNHTLTATKAGFATTERSVTLVAGQHSSVKLDVYRTADLIGYKRRWPVWPPAVVAAAGAALVGVGALLSVQEQAKLRAYDDKVESRPAGNPIQESALATRRAQAERYHRGAIAAYAIGGAAFVTGVALLVVNRSRPYRVDPLDRQKLAFSPFVGPQGAGLASAGHF